MKKILLSFLAFIVSIFSLSFTYEVSLPNSVSTSSSDIEITNNKVTDDTNYYIQISKTINDYLWFFLWSVAFAAVIYAGFLLLSSNWSDEDLKKWNKILTWWLVWIFVSLLSYAIVKLLIWLF